MRSNIRPEPVIPDHKVLRVIGGGAYGEVWLAEGVTGAMRAVKVVRREDFDDEKTFEREFDGILKYEPISRNHPGLIHILHIGRGVDVRDNPFYYYVMELGDDVHGGRSVNPIEYEARNLLTDMKHSGGQPLDPDEVISIGLILSDALCYLHDKDLAHRDIKPSNIIFLDGKPKLADIGLVAARGQMTFVGTEGFVPPEGPGTAEADVYALGKVLYEMVSGKDRLDFPELPDELPELSHKKRWQALNQLICDVCEPRADKRIIKSAEDLSDGLRRLQIGRRLKRRRRSLLMVVLPLLLLSGLLIMLFNTQIKALWDGFVQGKQDKNNHVLVEEYGFVKVLSEPAGAEVYDSNGNFLDLTPLANIKLQAGSYYEFEFRMRGFRTGKQEGVVQKGKTTIVEQSMVIYSPLIKGQDWVDNLGVSYESKDDFHISKRHILYSQWRRFVNSNKTQKKPLLYEVKEQGVTRNLIMVTQAEANSYVVWLNNLARSRDYINESQSFYAVLDKQFKISAKQTKKYKGRYPFKTVVKNIPYARLELQSNPVGAKVMMNGVFVGYTPLYLNKVKPGSVKLELSCDGYRKVMKKLTLKDRSSERFDFQMRENSSVVFGENWENSLGMRFVPLSEGQEVLVSIWETRVLDYKKYIEVEKLSKTISSRLEDKHPITGISRVQANEFCEWLTAYERKSGRITQESHYRLPSDEEWSIMAGLVDDPAKPPAEREFNSLNIFPWGITWPPENEGRLVGNLAGLEVSEQSYSGNSKALIGYSDGHTMLAPVGSFPTNSLGLHDLAGNVYEWVSDDYSEGSNYGVLRGGSWRTYLKDHLYVKHRNVVKPSKMDNTYGFRVVLERVATDETSP